MPESRSEDDHPLVARTGRSVGRLFSPFRVERMFWVVGTVLVLILCMVFVATSDQPSNSAEAWGARIGLSLIGGWGLARWFAGDPEPENQLGWAPTALLLLVVIGPLGGRAIDALVPNTFAFGSAERWLVLPAFLALVMIFFRALALHRYVSQVAAGLIALAFLSVFEDGPEEMATVSTATGTQLSHSRDEGVPILVRGTTFREGEDRVSAVRPLQSPRECQTLRFVDQRHGLIGLAGRRIDLTFEACWARTREPLSLTVTTSQDRREQRGTLRPVRLVPGDPFRYASGGSTNERVRDIDDAGDGQQLRYGDRSSDLGDDLLPEFGPVVVRDEQGRVRTDGAARNDFVVARVLARGNQIEVVVAFESRDRFFRGEEPVEDTAAERVAGATPGRGVALDVVTASLYVLGGSEARLSHVTAGGETTSTPPSQTTYEPVR